MNLVRSLGRRRGLSTVYDISLVTRKEVRQLWRDKASLTLTFIIPVVILLAFGVTIPSSSSLAATNVPINTVVCDFDNTTLSHDFTAIIGNSTSLSLTFLQDASQARSGVEWGTYSAAIIIYQGFAANITRLALPE